MNLHNIEKESRLYYAIRGLDEQIIKLEKLAQKVADGDTSTRIVVQVEDLKKKQEMNSAQQAKGMVDDDDWYSTFRRMALGTSPLAGFSYDYNKPSQPAHIETYDEELSEFYTLHLIGFLIADKKSKREAMLRQLEELRSK